jgi:hypothetical protein
MVGEAIAPAAVKLPVTGSPKILDVPKTSAYLMVNVWLVPMARLLNQYSAVDAGMKTGVLESNWIERLVASAGAGPKTIWVEVPLVYAVGKVAGDCGVRIGPKNGLREKS